MHVAPLRVSSQDAAYIERVWRSVPLTNRATTAILHLPRMTHRPDAQTLCEVLPSLISWAASGLSPDLRPSAKSLGGLTPCTLVTADHPEGEVLIPIDGPLEALAQPQPQQQPPRLGLGPAMAQLPPSIMA